MHTCRPMARCVAEQVAAGSGLRTPPSPDHTNMYGDTKCHRSSLHHCSVICNMSDHHFDLMSPPAAAAASFLMSTLFISPGLTLP